MSGGDYITAEIVAKVQAAHSAEIEVRVRAGADEASAQRAVVSIYRLREGCDRLLALRQGASRPCEITSLEDIIRVLDAPVGPQRPSEAELAFSEESALHAKPRERGHRLAPNEPRAPRARMTKRARAEAIAETITGEEEF